MANSYVEDFRSKVDFPKPFQRTGKFPLDRTDLFSSYADAVKYAKGDRTDPDSRKLCGTSYIGQHITVYENDKVDTYVINPDRTLKKLTAMESVSTTLEAGELSIEITLPEGSTFMKVDIIDSVTNEVVFTDVSHLDNVVTISVAEGYENPLGIVVFYTN